MTAPSQRRRPTELQCQQTIVDAARKCGWLVHAERPALARSGKWSTPVQGHAGFPDLVLVTPDRRSVHFVELKRKPNKVEPAQLVWLDALRAVGERTPFVRTHVWWVPEGMPAVLDFLRNEGRGRSRSEVPS